MKNVILLFSCITLILHGSEQSQLMSNKRKREEPNWSELFDQTVGAVFEKQKADELAHPGRMYDKYINHHGTNYRRSFPTRITAGHLQELKSNALQASCASCILYEFHKMGYQHYLNPALIALFQQKASEYLQTWLEAHEKGSQNRNLCISLPIVMVFPSWFSIYILTLARQHTIY